MAALYAITLFVSAALLFWVQPKVAKMLLTFLGGTPAIWNTCMVFFQGILLAGYAYAHYATTHLSRRSQTILHAILLSGAFISLPLAIPAGASESLPTETTPVWWLLFCLVVMAGLPFFVVSTSGPLLQKWFSNTRHPSAKDPYFLYAASNAGSLMALLGYPVIVEPFLPLRQQSLSWTLGYLILAALISGCMRMRQNHSVETVSEAEGLAFKKINWKQRLRWVLLSMLPSSLMLGVTTYLTTDIASIPLLWVLPLSLYLLTFILVFSRSNVIPHRWMSRPLPIVAIILCYLLLSEATEPAWILILLHTTFFFVSTMVCHGLLAKERPISSHLTEYYLWISAGGVLGGIFNTLLAPLLFNTLIEYPLAIILVCLIGIDDSASKNRPFQKIMNTGVPFLLGLATALMIVFVPAFELAPSSETALIFGIPLILSYTLAGKAIRFSLALSLILLASTLYRGVHGETLLADRNFFGLLRVTKDPSGRFHRMVHGNTIHGQQFVDPARKDEPLSYYHRSGPLGQIFATFHQEHPGTNIAVIGLGTGTMACYAEPTQSWRFYEINPAVVRMAENTNYFTFLSQMKGASKMVLGDARLRLREAPDYSFGMIVLDAFSSDSIPMHLITREAIDLYLSKLAPEGILAFHISNRSLDLEPILGRLAAAASMACHAQDDMFVSSEEDAEGKAPSHWVVMARKSAHLGSLAKDSRWLPVSARPDIEIWTDDFSNILSAFRWH